MPSEFNLDREMNIQNNVDATGKKWVIHTERGRHLFYTLPEGARPDAVIPDRLKGMFTKRMYLVDEIQRHVHDSWEHADAIKLKNERKAQAAKEQEANARKEAKESAKANSKAKVSKQESSNDDGGTE